MFPRTAHCVHPTPAAQGSPSQLQSGYSALCSSGPHWLSPQCPNPPFLSLFFFSMIRRPPSSPFFPYTTLSRSRGVGGAVFSLADAGRPGGSARRSDLLIAPNLVGNLKKELKKKTSRDATGTAVSHARPPG